MESDKIYLIDRPGAAQTVISEILPGPTRDRSDHYPFQLADAVWGGAAGARLGTNLREEKGYSYGVFSFPSFYSKAGVWIASGGVQTDKTKESVIEFDKELHNIAGRKPVSQTELATAKSFRIRGYAQKFESLGRISGQIVEFWSLGLPLSDLQREPGELDKETLESVNATAEKYANPSHATMLMVGDAGKIEADVRSLKLHEVVRLDVEGRPVSNSRN
jgi:zinc protease